MIDCIVVVVVVVVVVVIVVVALFVVDIERARRMTFFTTMPSES
jgi:hypothetical protein